MSVLKRRMGTGTSSMFAMRSLLISGSPNVPLTIHQIIRQYRISNSRIFH